MGALKPSAIPTPKMKRLYHELVGMWGEPTDLFVFDAADNNVPVQIPLIHVPCWSADDACDVTTLQTLGMSEQLMPGADGYVELHLAYRGKLANEQLLVLARMLADIAEYPFHRSLKLAWWEVIRNVPPIPVFDGCKHLLVQSPFTAEGTAELPDDDGPVKLLYMVPITAHERHLLVEHGRDAFLDYIAQSDIDLLQGRLDPPA
jgi:hypothetical protein